MILESQQPITLLFGLVCEQLHAFQSHRPSCCENQAVLWQIYEPLCCHKLIVQPLSIALQALRNMIVPLCHDVHRYGRITLRCIILMPTIAVSWTCCTECVNDCPMIVTQLISTMLSHCEVKH